MLIYVHPIHVDLLERALIFSNHMYAPVMSNMSGDTANTGKEVVILKQRNLQRVIMITLVTEMVSYSVIISTSSLPVGSPQSCCRNGGPIGSAIVRLNTWKTYASYIIC